MTNSKTLFSTLILALILFSNCNKDRWSEIGCYKACGELTTEERDLPDFTSIELKSDADITLKQVASESGSKFVITTEEDIHEHISTEVVNGKLIINNECCLRDEHVTIYIEMAELKELETSGSGDISTQNTFETNAFKAKISGSGNMVLALDAASTDFQISGSGNITSTGASKVQNSKISGSGNINCYDLEGMEGYASIGGSGDIKVNVEESLDASISGSGDITYRGEPAVSRSVTGSGSVSAK